ncbi:hypothetical protein [Goodfellowiella coeruleoviolacea]|uniref:Uncharacterized protein n=1 Tax=Goodfellowiella coeruleoviolacea TaxID=334858 RepID=A0AAE3GBF4_9PSEU|nr:hypothetical protein [Goodfellowiella coeruleoviolacea]MCP2165212.1 hypothetical protein [Goodfellowiella coeruleoviolacea]
MSGWLRRLARRLGGQRLPEGFPGTLAAGENVVAVAEERSGGHLVATSLGLWLPEGERTRRVGWHLISKAVWQAGALAVVEARQTGTAGAAVLLADLPTRRFTLTEPGRVPEVVHARVTGSIRSSHRRELPGGGAWFVQRKVPGQDGVVLQVRADPGTDAEALRVIAEQVAARVDQVRRAAPDA